MFLVFLYHLLQLQYYLKLKKCMMLPLVVVFLSFEAYFYQQYHHIIKWEVYSRRVDILSSQEEILEISNGKDEYPNIFINNSQNQKFHYYKRLCCRVIV